MNLPKVNKIPEFMDYDPEKLDERDMMDHMAYDPHRE